MPILKYINILCHYSIVLHNNRLFWLKLVHPQLTGIYVGGKISTFKSIRHGLFMICRRISENCYSSLTIWLPFCHEYFYNTDFCFLAYSTWKNTKLLCNFFCLWSLILFKFNSFCIHNTNEVDAKMYQRKTLSYCRHFRYNTILQQSQFEQIKYYCQNYCNKSDKITP